MVRVIEATATVELRIPWVQGKLRGVCAEVLTRRKNWGSCYYSFAGAVQSRHRSTNCCKFRWRLALSLGSIRQGLLRWSDFDASYSLPVRRSGQGQAELRLARWISDAGAGWRSSYSQQRKVALGKESLGARNDSVCVGIAELSE